MSAHALLSASSASRWLACPPSARLGLEFEDTVSEYAQEGSLAHEIGELKLRKHFIEPMGPKKFKTAMGKLEGKALYADEMQRFTEEYVDFVRQIVHSFEKTPHIAIEQRLDFSRWVPEGFGTGDCVIVGDGKLVVIDFKYGKGVKVSAKNNPQMKLYALGALDVYSLLYDIKEVSLAVVQPRVQSCGDEQWSLSVDELLSWGESVKSVAQLAFEGKGEFASGEHCRFCKAKATCRYRADNYTDCGEFYQYKSPHLLQNNEVGDVLKKMDQLTDWVKSLEGYALGELLAGREIDGFKAVEGPSRRAFTDVDKAFEKLENTGYDRAVLYENKPITLTAVEKLLGKDFNNLIGEYITKKQGQPTLAQISDRRDAIIINSALQDFKEV